MQIREREKKKRTKPHGEMDFVTTKIRSDQKLGQNQTHKENKNEKREKKIGSHSKRVKRTT